ncbi:MAG: hypothetical protein DRI77_14230 [Chloroflexi bacterium]|nr:MAG: hypothetical protein DRI77_14230 [Chloroflexota bacterium]
MGTRVWGEEAVMKCVICKQGETMPGHTEAYVSEEVAAQLLAEAEEAVRDRVQVNVREFAPAMA